MYKMLCSHWCTEGWPISQASHGAAIAQSLCPWPYAEHEQCWCGRRELAKRERRERRGNRGSIWRREGVNTEREKGEGGGRVRGRAGGREWGAGLRQTVRNRGSVK